MSMTNSTSHVSLLPENLRAFMARRFKQMKGLALVAFALAISCAFLSWSINDPSINNATQVKPQNLLGVPGAMIADMVFQTIGLSAISLTLPLFIWGWQTIKHVSTHLYRWHILSWLFAVIFFSGFASCLMTPQGWPLETGLGGIIGDKLSYLPIKLMGLAVGKSFANAVACFAFLSLGIVALLASLDLRIKEEERPQQVIVDEDKSPIDTILGMCLHMWMRIKSSFISLITFRFLTRKKTDHLQPSIDRAMDQEYGQKKGVFSALKNMFFRSKTPVRGNRIEPRFDGPIAQTGDQYGYAPQAAPEPAKPARTRKKAVSQSEFNFAGGDFQLPSINLLAEAPITNGQNRLDHDTLQENARLLESVLEDFGVKGQIINVRPGPVVTLYELEPAPGIKSSRVIGLSDDIARSMSAISVRVAVVPGRNVIGIELPNDLRETVYLSDLLMAKDYQKSSTDLALVLGKDIGDEPMITDLARMPHLLIAGTTGSGKSVGINTMILSLLYRLPPDKCKMIMIDPKMLELSVYDGIPHLLTPVVTDPKKAVVALKWAVREMEERYRNMAKLGVRNIDGYNKRIEQAEKKGETLGRTIQTGFDPESGQPIFETEEISLEPMPYIVVIVDEMADLMMVAGKDIEGAIQRLAQMARAAGIHMITATQRPSVDVITGTIKANFPTRISFQVTSKIDSRTILGEQGAEQLLGQGDMLFMAGGGRVTRIHGAFVSDEEVESVVSHLKTQGTPDYLEEVTIEPEEEQNESFAGDGQNQENSLFDQAVAIVARDRKASTSYIQRRLSIGYNRAATIIEQMEEQGMISRANHAGKRDILLPENDQF